VSEKLSVREWKCEESVEKVEGVWIKGC